MVNDLLKHWEPLAIMALSVVTFAARRLDHVEEYRCGRDVMAVGVSNCLKDDYIEQAKTAHEARQKATTALADRQVKLEKERENAKQTAVVVRFRPDRLQQYVKR